MYVLGLMLTIGAVTFSCALPTQRKDHCKFPPRLELAELMGDWKEETFPLEHIVNYICRPGYSRLGTLKMVCREGTWHWISRGQCRKRSCGNPGDIDFGTFELKNGDDFVFGAIVEYSCEPGYQMISKHKTIECTATGWSRGLPHCEARLCPPVVDDSVKVLSTVFDEEYTVGHVINLQCKNPNDKLHGPSEIYCTSDGTWNEDPPTCKGPCIVQNDKMKQHNIRLKIYQRLRFAHDEMIEFECNPGYEISDPKNLTVKCNKGVVTYSTCHLRARLCPPVVDDSVRVFPTVSDEEYTVGHVINLQCKNPNDKLHGPSEIYCTSNGTWNEDPPTCKGPCIVQNNKMKQHNIRLKIYQRLQFAHNEVIGFECKPGYEISDPINLNVKCNKGVVTYPTCHLRALKIKKKMCPPPPKVLFGESMGEIKQLYDSGTNIYYKCLSYFKHNGKQKIKCRNGVWETPPTCIEPCVLNDNYIKGNNTIADAREKFIVHGETVKFNCLPTFKISNPRLLNVKCLKGNLKYPKCVKMEPCALDESIMLKNNITVKDVNKHCGSQRPPYKFCIKHNKENETIKFTCLPGYEISDHEKLKVKCHNGVLEYPNCLKITAEEITVQPSVETEIY